MNKLINPKLTVKKVILTKQLRLEGDYDIIAVDQEITFSNKTIAYYKLDECKLYDKKYSNGLYEWDGKKFKQLEDWTERPDVELTE